MASGFVYLRPTTVVYFREIGERSIAADNAWRKMNSWLDEHYLRNEIERGFGILTAKHPDKLPDHYDACVELPASVNNHTRKSLKFRKMPGGAYARKRHNGAHELIGDIISQLQSRLSDENGLSYDPRRPTIEIYLNDPKKVITEKLRTDICLPVSAIEQSSRGQHAA